MPDQLDFIAEIRSGKPSPKALQWLRVGFDQALQDNDPRGLHDTLGLNTYSSGWTTEYRRREWNVRLRQCREILTDMTPWSAAVLISDEMAVQARSQRPPTSDLARLIREAIEIHPGGTRTRDGIYHALGRLGE
jgi:hypothetical protein